MERCETDRRRVWLITTNDNIDGVRFYQVARLPAIMAAVCLFALAEAFAYGARLREDVDATI
jgi:hypothetical protein